VACHENLGSGWPCRPSNIAVTPKSAVLKIISDMRSHNDWCRIELYVYRSLRRSASDSVVQLCKPVSSITCCCRLHSATYADRQISSASRSQIFNIVLTSFMLLDWQSGISCHLTFGTTESLQSLEKNSKWHRSIKHITSWKVEKLDVMQQVLGSPGCKSHDIKIHISVTIF